MDAHDPPLPQPDDDASAGLGIRQFLGLGAMVVGCVVVCLFVGVMVDVWLGSGPVFLLVGTTVGVVLAATGFWLRVRAYLRG